MYLLSFSRGVVEEIDERTPPLGGHDVGAPEALPAGEGFVLASLVGSPPRAHDAGQE
jgi:hypothetical protein